MSGKLTEDRRNPLPDSIPIKTEALPKPLPKSSSFPAPFDNPDGQESVTFPDESEGHTPVSTTRTVWVAVLVLLLVTGLLIFFFARPLWDEALRWFSNLPAVQKLKPTPAV